jgi:hypothetical protein
VAQNFSRELVLSKMAGVKRNRGKVWSNEATKTLLNLWCDEAIQVAFDQCKGSKETSKVYQRLLVSYSAYF